MRWVAILLTCLGGTLPIAALIWAWAVTHHEHATLDTDLARIQAITKQHPQPSEATPLMYAVRQPTANWTTVTYMPEEVRRAILASALKDLKGPALLAGAGALAGTVGSLLAFYV